VADGRSDWAAVPPGAAPGDLNAAGTIKPGVRSSERFFGFNLGDPKYGANPDFRKAILRAIDRQKIAAEILGSTDPMNGVVPPSLSHANIDPCPEVCAYDVEAAKALLASAFPFGGVPVVRIDYYTGATDEDQVQQRVAEAMQADLQAIGVGA